MTKAKRICSSSIDARLGYHTHDQYGEFLKLRLVVCTAENGSEYGCVDFPFTRQGLSSAKKYLADDANFLPDITSRWFQDNWGNRHAE